MLQSQVHPAEPQERVQRPLILFGEKPMEPPPRTPHVALRAWLGCSEARGGFGNPFPSWRRVGLLFSASLSCLSTFFKGEFQGHIFYCEIMNSCLVCSLSNTNHELISGVSCAGAHQCSRNPLLCMHITGTGWGQPLSPGHSPGSWAAQEGSPHPSLLGFIFLKWFC